MRSEKGLKDASVADVRSSMPRLAATMHVPKTRTSSALDQKVPSSSMTKSTPAMGARKAPESADPAPQPTVSTQRRPLPWSTPERLSSGMKRPVTWLPMHAPMWISGPSVPSARPEADTSTSETVFTASVRMDVALGSMVPLSSSSTDAMPDPAAAGATISTSSAETTLSAMPTAAYTRKAAPGPDDAYSSCVTLSFMVSSASEATWMAKVTQPTTTPTSTRMRGMTYCSRCAAASASGSRRIWRARKVMGAS
mmetsp:Transcript_10117/g.29834  ORF Transcript_10117/g.29834 Transcript_10117/m.29834 type:complete len:253 (+) Transcript_10117:466-1224(+)